MNTQNKKYDTGKPLLGLLHKDFSNALLAVGEVATFGANKYEPSGWKTIKNSEERYHNALHRHLNASDRGEEIDEESKLLHAAHTAWNALALLELEIERKNKKIPKNNETKEPKTDETLKKIIKWFSLEDRGISSKAMAYAVAGIKPDVELFEFDNYPVDPADFKRCINFLIAVPEARAHMCEIAKLSPAWAELIANWAELESIYIEESGSDRSSKLYKRMQEIIAGAKI